MQLKLSQVKLTRVIFRPKNKDIIKGLLELKNTIKNSKIKTIKKIFQSQKIQPKIIKIKAKIAKLRLENVMIIIILNTKE